MLLNRLPKGYFCFFLEPSASSKCVSVGTVQIYGPLKNGSSEYDAHVWRELGNLICWRQSFTSFRIYTFFRIPLFVHTTIKNKYQDPSIVWYWYVILAGLKSEGAKQSYATKKISCRRVGTGLLFSCFFASLKEKNIYICIQKSVRKSTNVS